MGPGAIAERRSAARHPGMDLVSLGQVAAMRSLATWIIKYNIYSHGKLKHYKCTLN
ncbi:protein of unknown function [Rhodovastum atsumiense]|nr:protein of unknown function [Rhodovastum atsumiense]